MIFCPACGKELNVITAIYDTPYFGKILLTSINCQCGFKHSDSFSAQIRDPVRFKLEISKKTLFSKIVRSASGTIRIPELGLAMEPGPASQGFITNVEGVLIRFQEIVEMAKRWNSDNQKAVERCELILDRLKNAIEGNENLTLILEDPYGNSAIIDDGVFMEKLDHNEMKELKTGLTVVELMGEDHLQKTIENE